VSRGGSSRIFQCLKTMANFFDKSRSKHLWLHISFWCVYLSFNLYQVSVFQRRFESFDWSKGITVLALQFVLTLFIAYFNYFYLLPRFLVRKNWLRYILEFSIPFAVVVLARVHLHRYIIDGYTHQDRYAYSPTFIIHSVVITLFIAIFIGFLRFVSDWFEFQATKKEVETEKLTAELNFLKAQINPHFLFNTLNNLYYLAYSKSPNTTEVIAKLSQVMRYMIHDSNHPRVLLSKEIEYMENYIALEKLRLNDQTTITFNIQGNTAKVKVAPLILITFLENAFKHGITNTSSASWINILIEIVDNELIYVVENSKTNGAEQTEKSGIGLANVRRRLELLYPRRHELKVEDHADRYYIELKLNIGLND
jgi:two-component system, LytTR family, sensor histidine kinase AlgZ